MHLPLGKDGPKHGEAVTPHKLKRTCALQTGDPCFAVVTKYNYNIYILVTFFFARTITSYN